MTGIVFSTVEEAQPFLATYERGRFDGLGEGESFHDNRFLVSILGIGKIKAALRTERLLRTHDVSSLIHAGTCTALNDNLKVGDLVSQQWGPRIHDEMFVLNVDPRRPRRFVHDSPRFFGQSGAHGPVCVGVASLQER